jgi:hypothetical protein
MRRSGREKGKTWSSTLQCEPGYYDGHIDEHKTHSLWRKIHNELSVFISHGLFSSQEARFQDILNDIESFRVLSQEGYGDETAEERVMAPWFQPQEVTEAISWVPPA